MNRNWKTKTRLSTELKLVQSSTNTRRVLFQKLEAKNRTNQTNMASLLGLGAYGSDSDSDSNDADTVQQSTVATTSTKAATAAAATASSSDDSDDESADSSDDSSSESDGEGGTTAKAKVRGKESQATTLQQIRSPLHRRVRGHVKQAKPSAAATASKASAAAAAKAAAPTPSIKLPGADALFASVGSGTSFLSTSSSLAAADKLDRVMEMARKKTEEANKKRKAREEPSVSGQRC